MSKKSKERREKKDQKKIQSTVSNAKTSMKKKKDQLDELKEVVFGFCNSYVIMKNRYPHWLDYVEKKRELFVSENKESLIKTCDDIVKFLKEECIAHSSDLDASCTKMLRMVGEMEDMVTRADKFEKAYELMNAYHAIQSSFTDTQKRVERAGIMLQSLELNNPLASSTNPENTMDEATTTTSAVELDVNVDSESKIPGVTVESNIPIAEGECIGEGISSENSVPLEDSVSSDIDVPNVSGELKPVD